MKADGVDTNFQFITVTKPGAGWKNENEHIVRSHVMKLARKTHRHKWEKKKGQGPKVGKSRRGLSQPLVDENARHDEVIHLLSPQFPPPPYCRSSPKDHRLLIHISDFYSPLVCGISDKFVLWTKGVKNFLAIASSHDFVMHAILSWSATHLAHISTDFEMEQDMYTHRCLALKGLQEAITCFSKDNCVAVLCASIILSWQCSDSKSWAAMMRGCKTIKRKMASFGRNSFLDSQVSSGAYLAQDSAYLFAEKFLSRARQFHQKSSQPRDVSLEDAVHSLGRLKVASVQPKLLGAINNLIVFLQSMQDTTHPVHSLTREERLRPLREMLFWIPSQFMNNLNVHPCVMLLMAHLHAVALLIEPVTDIDSACFRRLNVAPIQAFYEEFMTKSRAEAESGQRKRSYRRALALMDFPLRAVVDFQRQLDKIDPNNLSCGCADTATQFNDLCVVRILENFPVGLWHHSLS